MNVQNEKGEVFCNYKCFSPQSELVWQIVSLLIDVQFCQNIIIKDVDFKPPLNSLWWPVYIINPVDNTLLPTFAFVWLTFSLYVEKEWLIISKSIPSCKEATMVSKSINNKLFWLQLCNLDVSAGLSKIFWVTELLKIRLQAFGIASLFFREDSKLCQLPAYIDSLIK